MQPLAIYYATREGQTRHIVEHLAAWLRARGSTVEVHELGQRGAEQPDLDRYAGVLLAASVHGGQHEREMVSFVSAHRAGLERMPAAFLSVSLSEAGAEDAAAPQAKRAAAAAAVSGVIERFFKDTGWRPERVMPVAGALLYTRYNVLVRLVMKWIARNAGAPTDTSRDYEFTDWSALNGFAEAFVASLPGGAAASEAPRQAPQGAR